MNAPLRERGCKGPQHGMRDSQGVPGGRKGRQVRERPASQSAQSAPDRVRADVEPLPPGKGEE
eukprot:4284634-Alexandrium_andersonii.AAC.1